MSDFRDKCYTCAYKARNPGSAHIRCTYAWAKSNLTPPPGTLYGVRQGWYIFPLMYDPTWMAEECQAWAKECDPEMTQEKQDPLLEMLAIFRSVGRL